MNFKTATDGLFDRVDHAELADTLGVSVATIRQARLSPDAKAFRQPPEQWKTAVIRLAEQRAAHYKRLADNLRRTNGEGAK
jgi:hypothetical protein